MMPDSGGDSTGGGAVTLGERLRHIEGKVDETRDLVGALTARDSADTVRFGHFHDRIAHLESSITWLWRTVIAAVIGATITGLYLGPG